jgi:hypothetical protein
VGFYAVYYHTHETWWYLRFLLPAFPPLIVGATWVSLALLDRVPAARRRRAARIAGVAVAVLVIAHNVYWARRLEVLDIGYSEGVYPETAAWLTGHLPPDSVVLAMQVSGAVFYYTDFPIVRWDRCQRSELQALESRVLATGRPLYAVFFPFEIEDLRALDHVPGYWQRIGHVRHVTVWRLIADEGGSHVSDHRFMDNRVWPRAGRARRSYEDAVDRDREPTRLQRDVSPNLRRCDRKASGFGLPASGPTGTLARGMPARSSHCR